LADLLKYERAKGIQDPMSPLWGKTAGLEKSSKLAN